MLRTSLVNFIAGIALLLIFPQWSEAQWVKNYLPYTNFLTISALTVNGNNIFVGTDYGVFHSSDSGMSWKMVFPLSNGIVSISQSSNSIFAGWYGGLFRSQNNGITWNAESLGLPEEVYVYSIASYKSNMLYAGTDLGMYLSTDTGVSWSIVNTGFPVYYDIYAIAVNSRNIYAGTWRGVYRSIDSGTGDVPELVEIY
jgi:photosystem II stability/assembly factor-like uncharacterized protein